MTFEIRTDRSIPLSPFLFGHNLEHARAAVGGGLSAQMLRNRKFAGKPARNSGVASEWSGIGDRTFFQCGPQVSYTRHIGCEKMRRRNELQSQSVQNLHGGPAGIAQGSLEIRAGSVYEIRTVTLCPVPVVLTVLLTDRNGGTVYAAAKTRLSPRDWQISEFRLQPGADDREACLRLVFEEKTEVIFGAVSMMKGGHFHGMRSDVVQCLKALGPSVIRWPGGNFAGEYRWKDGLLPADMRGPLQAVTEDETQPYSHGYDDHGISTDDFLALCREVGAEPMLTINLAWNSPEDSRDWVEYCNGSAETPYGRLRAENGHPEPYHVRFWSLGNEMGYGHMEGPMDPEAYAALAATHAKRMLDVNPELVLCSSGPYPREDWVSRSAAALFPSAQFVSLHHYANLPMDYTTPEKALATYRRIVASAEEFLAKARTMRSMLDATGKKIHISFDEWNVWYSWFRPSCTGEGIFTAKMIHLFLRESERLDIPFCCYFQPVGEGAVRIDASSARLTANGQVFAMMKAHCGGALCEVMGEDSDSVAASIRNGILTVTLINEDAESRRDFSFAQPGEVLGSLLLSCDEITPYSYFTESPLPVAVDNGKISVTLPPHSTARIMIRPAAGPET